MSYIYKLKDNANLELLNEIGFELLPSELYGDGLNETIYYKIVEQPQDGQCVQQLVAFYNSIADKICTDQEIRRAHCKMGIKFRFRDGHYHLILGKEMLKMFTLWRVEFDMEERELYFTISDGNMPRFYDSREVLDKYCSELIETLKINDLIEEEELKEKKPKQEEVV